MEKVTGNNEVHLSSIRDHSKGKSDFLKEIIKDIPSRQSLLERVINKKTHSQIKWK